MFHKLLKRIYKFFILQAIFVDKSCLEKVNISRNLEKFSDLTLDTIDGDHITFNFYMTEHSRNSFIKNFVVEVDITDGFSTSFRALSNKVVIAVKLALLPIHYKTLSIVLYDTYLQKAFDFLQSESQK